MKDTVERRNEAIRTEYRKLIEQGKRHGEAIDIISDKFFLSFSTLERLLRCWQIYGDGKVRMNRLQ